MAIRPVMRISQAAPTIEGAGVQLKRAFGFSDTEKFDPFLLLDDFRGDEPRDYHAGFPWHPHRGIQTVTYMLEGRVEHEDSMGNKGVVGPGGVQWMTAGSGIIHQEMPEGDNEGRMYGFQLWVNLPSDLKMTEPEYQEFAPDEIPEKTDADGTVVKVICGELSGVVGPVKVTGSSPVYADLIIPPGTEKSLEIPTAQNAIIYVYNGQAVFPQGEVAENLNLVLFGEGDEVRIKSGQNGVSLLLMSGVPIKQPVAWRGPIVMNTQKELNTAFRELENGTFLKIN